MHGYLIKFLLLASVYASTAGSDLPSYGCYAELSVGSFIQGDTLKEQRARSLSDCASKCVENALCASSYFCASNKTCVLSGISKSVLETYSTPAALVLNDSDCTLVTYDACSGTGFSSVNMCELVTCQNNGTCVNTTGFRGFYCACPNYFSGRWCEIQGVEEVTVVISPSSTSAVAMAATANTAEATMSALGYGSSSESMTNESSPASDEISSTP
ncbi:uncharacterized protein LOC106179398 [Lingula anatina]|uniref:Uncharacterized protein LOC106179398 n=1 Tax=Lingula anatina TaxID=7574 RepID=A0A1S3K756_LINAN|nr:uncharacterized protein LOC106179398 [Lingula anatina]|eukprot:XP_013418465.1 uncharacterized protein LOC106179398 [Lingula anatina]